MLIDAVVNFKNYWRHPTNLIALEFGVVSFSFTAIHNIFMLYFVDMFLFKYGLNYFWLCFSQLCFVLWNFSSHYFMGNPKQSSKYEMTVTFGGPVLAVVFLLPFVFQISTSKIFIGIYFTLFLCLYDTLFNRVLLSRSVWLQENVVNLKDKLKIHFLGFIFASVASCSVFPSYLYYNTGSFRWFCLVLSMLSFLGFIFSSFCHLLRENDKSLQPATPPTKSSFHSSNHKPLLDKSPNSSPTLASSSNKYNYNTTRPDANNIPGVGLLTLAHNVISHTNMAIYIGVNVLQVFSSTYSVVFLHLFISRMVNIDVKWRAVVLFVCFFSPVLMNIVLSVITTKRDKYDLLKILFQAKIGISVFALVFGQHVFVAIVFTVFSRAIVESVFGLLMFVNQDVDNEHHVKFGYRKTSQRLVSLGKIGQAAAPIVGVLAFASFSDAEDSTEAKVSDTHLFYSTILVMLLSGCLQYYIWAKYTLYGSYLKDINVMAKGKLSTSLDGGESGLRNTFSERLFDHAAATTSPNMNNISAITHKPVITVV